MRNLRCSFVACSALAVTLLSTCAVCAQSAAEVESTRAKLVVNGAKFLYTAGQAADGSYSAATGTGVTALVTSALLRNDAPPTEPHVAKSLKYLEAAIQPDGGIYAKGSRLKNYETCLAIMCFNDANKDGKYKNAIAAAEKFIRSNQIGGGDAESGDAEFGGVGYGGKGRPDLSNTAFFVETLKTIGAKEDDEAIQRALKFISRCQNLETEHNNTPNAGKNPDGGFYYTPTGDSPAGKTPNGGLRSYGSMSYAGLKSMIYAGLKQDDPRVKAALEWAKKNYSVSSNPGLGSAGVYYYLQLFATAMNATGLDSLEDANGKQHNWRAELVAELAKRQAANGSWTNSDTKWLEGDPNLVTGYALLTLASCKQAKAK
jgi:squalene-hopene/tetraprenyl-beta-curcumene cyclase